MTTRIIALSALSMLPLWVTACGDADTLDALEAELAEYDDNLCATDLDCEPTEEVECVPEDRSEKLDCYRSQIRFNNEARELIECALETYTAANDCFAEQACGENPACFLPITHGLPCETPFATIGMLEECGGIY